jgi:uncharacterized protein (DUF1697 family)
VPTHESPLIVLLRGINLGSHNRIAMPALRDALEAAGFGEARTYVQSGNVVLRKQVSAKKIRELISTEFGLDVDVVTRSRDELAAVVKRNPLKKVAKDPKRYQVSFLDSALSKDAVAKLESLRADGERLAVHGREVYAWHPAGVARSKLWAALAGKGLGVTATSRNWTTVEALLALADENPG